MGTLEEKMKTTIVTTTINVPTFLTAYHENAKRFGHDIDYIVVGDKKTPPEAASFCSDIPKCTYLDIPTQEYYMRRFPELFKHHPYNSVERRNIGIFMAYERGTEVLITLDDDNLATSHDMIGDHMMAGGRALLPTYGSSSGWFNVCQFLDEEN